LSAIPSLPTNAAAASWFLTAVYCSLLPPPDERSVPDDPFFVWPSTTTAADAYPSPTFRLIIYSFFSKRSLTVPHLGQAMAATASPMLCTVVYHHSLKVGHSIVLYAKVATLAPPNNHPTPIRVDPPPPLTFLFIFAL
jgi:hypothetical protein